MNKPKTMLFDYDSMVWQAADNIVSYEDEELWINQGKDNEWINEKKVELALYKLDQMQNKMFAYIESITGWDFTVEYYISTNHKNCARRSLSKDYKYKRTHNLDGSKKEDKTRDLVRLMINELKNFCWHSDKWEADDGVISAKIKYGDNAFIASIDKDLRHEGGYIFDYYKHAIFDEDDNPIMFEWVDKNGEVKESQKKNYRGFNLYQRKEGSKPFIAEGKKQGTYPQEIISEFKLWTKEEGLKMKWMQVLHGDIIDGYSGLKGVGKKGAEKILEGVPIEEMESVVKNEYMEREGSLKNFFITKFLAELGVDRELETETFDIDE